MTPKHRLFVSEYLIDQNASKAAKRAGFSPKAGPRLMKRPDVKEAIDKQLAVHGITADRVLNELALIAFSDLRGIYNNDGSVKPINEWPEEIAKCVSSMDAEELFEMNRGERVNMGTVKKIKLWSKSHALETLAKHLKILTDKVEHTVTLEQILGASRKEETL